MCFIYIYIYIYTHIYIYTYIKWRKDEIFPFVATWMDLEIITLSDVGGKKTNTI